ncbi:hypothetical protein CO038_02590 [Candidatus Pacearchaeota archaeon CG_4_9_14_0_2_um_filter_39_13]|nr:hypothetical protein [Candidatus Pacearchaeota archaeon]OIO44124.1 MAG: hypothetical protein AUJ64_00705 [Candidatus Pacearchaeota archaeon CG1_02_39_14]PJC44672.1 MAG: hypothetical protein CO038_02590 [Candidatus Pacearchaeota archaeon CG_4_9_14_0_2_um_filter_39_13]
MKKSGVLAFLFILLLLYPVIAQEEEGIDKAYLCLENQIANKTSGSLSLQEAVFSTLALGSESKLTDKIEDERSNQNCWPKESCTIKDTAQVLIAYDRINKNTESIQSYLLSRNGSATDLTWYLQVDISNHIPSACTFTYDERDYQVSIGEDMKISGSAGSCLQLSSSGYWLQISRNCFEKTFQVSCDEDFITSLLYQKSGSETIYVSSETHSAPSSGTTEERVDSQCFKSGSSCDYEGTLWAALALQKAGEEISSFLPYLLALSEDHNNLFPSSFLYLLTSGDDQYSQITQAQKTAGFWEAPNTKYNKFYDTSLGLLALQDSSAAESDTAKAYLLSVQTPKGCWNNNNIRDTAFLLYSGWPRGVSSGGGEGEGGELTCAGAGYYCGSQFDCAESEGQILNEFSCQGFQSCCSVPIIEQTCSEKSGVLCSFSEQCSGTEVSSVEGTCCLGSCRPITLETSECEDNGGFCSSFCEDNEEQASYSCGNSGGVCCIPSESSGGISLIWIVLLAILILLVVLGIIFRDKIKLWWFKMRNRKNSDKSPSEMSGPRPPPRFPPVQRGPPIQRQPLMRRPQPRRASSRADSDMEETLRKLKEMSK